MTSRPVPSAVRTLVLALGLYVGVLSAVCLAAFTANGFHVGPATVAPALSAPVPALSAPVTAQDAPAGVRDAGGAPCDTDAHCAAWQARQDAAAGRVPAVTFGPARDGGWAVSCPDGWDVTGSSVLDSRCVPSDVVTDA